VRSSRRIRARQRRTHLPHIFAISPAPTRNLATPVARSLVAAAAVAARRLLSAHAPLRPTAPAAVLASSSNMSTSTSSPAPAAPTRLEVSARYSEAVVWGGATVWLSGQVPENTAGAPAAAQTADVLALVDARLRAAGSDRSRLLSATIYMTDLARDYAAMNEVWDAWLPPGCAPARTTVGVTALARPGWALEVTVTAAVGGGAEGAPTAS
jgi:enamine deaminase RidA (YjgF/YER057c/UK114 family)